MLRNRVIASVIGVICVIITSLINNSKYSESKSRPLRVLVVCGHDVDCSRALVIAGATLKDISHEVGRKVSIVVTYSIPDESPEGSLARVLFWLNRTAEEANINKVDATLVFVDSFSVRPSFFYTDEIVTLGRASGIGNIGRGDSLAWAGMDCNDECLAVIIKHEIGHLFGAEHSSGDDIMNPDKASEFHAYSSEQISKIKAILALLP